VIKPRFQRGRAGGAAADSAEAESFAERAVCEGAQILVFVAFLTDARNADAPALDSRLNE
jgi:hypothetical protein